jgi:hypothetical protein
MDVRLPDVRRVRKLLVQPLLGEPSEAGIVILRDCRHCTDALGLCNRL